MLGSNAVLFRIKAASIAAVARGLLRRRRHGLVESEVIGEMPAGMPSEQATCSARTRSLLSDHSRRRHALHRAYGSCTKA